MTLIKEPYASLANQLELATPSSKMLLPIESRGNTITEQMVSNPKYKINKLQDSAI